MWWTGLDMAAISASLGSPLGEDSTTKERRESLFWCFFPLLIGNYLCVLALGAREDERFRERRPRRHLVKHRPPIT